MENTILLYTIATKIAMNIGGLVYYPASLHFVQNLSPKYEPKLSFFASLYYPVYLDNTILVIHHN